MSNSLQPHGLQPTRLLYPWGFSRQEYWSGLPCPSPRNVPDPQTEPVSPASPALAGRFFTTELPGGPELHGSYKQWHWNQTDYIWNTALSSGLSRSQFPHLQNGNKRSIYQTFAGLQKVVHELYMVDSKCSINVNDLWWSGGNLKKIEQSVGISLSTLILMSCSYHWSNSSFWLSAGQLGGMRLQAYPTGYQHLCPI